MKVCVIIRQARNSGARKIDSVWDERDGKEALIRVQKLQEEPSYNFHIEFYELERPNATN